MNKITINNTSVQVKEWAGKRVVTFKDIDRVHERPEGTARKRFKDNKKHLRTAIIPMVRISGCGKPTVQPHSSSKS